MGPHPWPHSFQRERNEYPGSPPNAGIATRSAKAVHASPAAAVEMPTTRRLPAIAAKSPKPAT